MSSSHAITRTIEQTGQSIQDTTQTSSAATQSNHPPEIMKETIQAIIQAIIQRSTQDYQLPKFIRKSWSLANMGDGQCSGNIQMMRETVIREAIQCCLESDIRSTPFLVAIQAGHSICSCAFHPEFIDKIHSSERLDDDFLLSLKICQLLIRNNNAHSSTSPPIADLQMETVHQDMTYREAKPILNRINQDLYGASHMYISGSNLTPKLLFLSYKLLLHALRKIAKEKKKAAESIDQFVHGNLEEAHLCLKFLCLPRLSLERFKHDGTENISFHFIHYLLNKGIADTKRLDDIFECIRKLMNKCPTNFVKHLFIHKLLRFLASHGWPSTEIMEMFFDKLIKQQELPPMVAHTFAKLYNVDQDMVLDTQKWDEEKNRVIKQLVSVCFNKVQYPVIKKIITSLKQEIPLTLDFINKIPNECFIKVIRESSTSICFSPNGINTLQCLLIPWLNVDLLQNTKMTLEQFTPEEFLCFCDNLGIHNRIISYLLPTDETLLRKWMGHMKEVALFSGCGHQCFNRSRLFDIFSTGDIRDRFSSTLFSRLLQAVSPIERTNCLHYLLISCMDRAHDSAEMRLLFTLLRDLGDKLIKPLYPLEKDLLSKMIFKSEKIEENFLRAFSSYLSQLSEEVFKEGTNPCQNGVYQTLKPLQSVLNFIFLFKRSTTFVDEGMRIFSKTIKTNCDKIADSMIWDILSSFEWETPHAYGCQMRYATFSAILCSILSVFSMLDLVGANPSKDNSEGSSVDIHTHLIDINNRDLLRDTSREQRVSLLLNLPRNILTLIASYLTPDDTVNLCSTSHDVCDIFREKRNTLSQLLPLLDLLIREGTFVHHARSMTPQTQITQKITCLKADNAHIQAICQALPIVSLMDLSSVDYEEKLIFLSRRLLFLTLNRVQKDMMHNYSFYKTIDRLVKSRLEEAEIYLNFCLEWLQHHRLDFCARHNTQVELFAEEDMPAAFIHYCLSQKITPENAQRLRNVCKKVCQFIECLEEFEVQRFLDYLFTHFKNNGWLPEENMQLFLSQLARQNEGFPTFFKKISRFLHEGWPEIEIHLIERLPEETRSKDQQKIVKKFVEHCNVDGSCSSELINQIVGNLLEGTVLTDDSIRSIPLEFFLRALRERQNTNHQLSRNMFENLRSLLISMMEFNVDLVEDNAQDSTLTRILENFDPKEFLNLCADLLTTKPNPLSGNIRLILSRNIPLLKKWIECMETQALFEKNGQIFSNIFFQIFSPAKVGDPFESSLYAELLESLNQDERKNFLRFLVVSCADKCTSNYLPDPEGLIFFSMIHAGAGVEGRQIPPLLPHEQQLVNDICFNSSETMKNSFSWSAGTYIYCQFLHRLNSNYVDGNLLNSFLLIRPLLSLVRYFGRITPMCVKEGMFGLLEAVFDIKSHVVVALERAIEEGYGEASVAILKEKSTAIDMLDTSLKLSAGVIKTYIKGRQDYERHLQCRMVYDSVVQFKNVATHICAEREGER